MNPDMNILGLLPSDSPAPSPLIAVGPILVLILVFLWIRSLIHCIRNKDLSDTNRIIGTIVIVFLLLLGSLIYLFIPRGTNS